MEKPELFELDPDALALIDQVSAAGDELPEEAWAPLLVDILRVLEALALRRGAEPAAAFDSAQASVLALAEYFGGRMTYLPRGQLLRTALRDAQMWREYDHKPGTVRRLAEKYGMTEIHTYAVLRKQRILHRDRMQGRLFEPQSRT